MPEKVFILSQARDLGRIKRHQYIRVIPSVVVIGLGIGLQYWFPGANFLNYPALAISVAGIIWYLWIISSHRFNNKIPQAHEGDIVSPFEGKISYVRRNSDITLINIHKSFFDVVELRCPHSSCTLEDDVLKLQSPLGTISFRFNAKNLEWVKRSDWETGELIATVYGKASCTISLPAAFESPWREKSLVFAGASVLGSLNPEAKPSILVEEESND